LLQIYLRALKTAEDLGRALAIAPTMPRHKPRYVMGIGTAADLLAAVRSGVDMFDCVIPTRHARNGQMIGFPGRFNIKNGRFRRDDRPVDPECGCMVCARFSRSYLRHLHEHGDPLYVRLATIHNLYFFHEWVAVMRRAIRLGQFARVAAGLERVLAAATKPGDESSDDLTTDFVGCYAAGAGPGLRR
jgi:queuine tRNA-ribosyltransferase